MLAIYCRISKNKEEGKDRSIEDQKQLGIAKAKELGLDYTLFIDEGLTAYTEKLEDRPAFWKMLDEVSNGNISAVFAFDQSRFERNSEVRNILKKIFKKNNIKWYTHIDGLVDLTNAETELFGDIMSLFNNYSVTMTKRKVISVLKRRAEEGKAHGITAYGYQRDKDGLLVINNEESEVVKLIFELSLNGMGTNSIAEHLNKEKIPTRYNKIGIGTIKFRNKYTDKITTKNKTDIQWAGNTIRNIIKNEIYFGKRTFGKLTSNIAATYKVPAIFEKSYWEIVNDNLKNNSNNCGKKIIHSYLLKGLLRCGICGRNMYGKTRVSKKDNYYMCSSKRKNESTCCNRSINIDKMDSFIWKMLFGVPSFIERLEKELSEDVELKAQQIKISFENKRLEAYRDEKQKTISLCTKGTISEEDLILALKPIDAEIKRIEFFIKEFKIKEIRFRDGSKKLKEIKDSFVEYTKLTDFHQKVKVINEIIKNIVVEFVDNTYYKITIEYRVGYPNETWKTSNERCDLFHKLKFGEDGKIDGVIMHPHVPLSNPEDNSLISKFQNYQGFLSDFK